jgi:hypothetical protein
MYTLFVPLPPPSLPPPPTLGRTYSTLLISDFVEEKTQKIKKKNMTFFPVWDKDSYIGRLEDYMCCFHACMYYNPYCFISTRPLHYPPVPSL